MMSRPVRASGAGCRPHWGRASASASARTPRPRSQGRSLSPGIVGTEEVRATSSGAAKSARAWRRARDPRRSRTKHQRRGQGDQQEQRVRENHGSRRSQVFSSACAGAGEDEPHEEHPGEQLVVPPGLIHLDLDPFQRIYLGHDPVEAFGIAGAVVLTSGSRRQGLERRFVPSFEAGRKSAHTPDPVQPGLRGVARAEADRVHPDPQSPSRFGCHRRTRLAGVVGAVGNEHNGAGARRQILELVETQARERSRLRCRRAASRSAPVRSTGPARRRRL